MVVDVVVAVVVVDVPGFSFGGIVSKCTVVVVKLDEEIVVVDIVVVVLLDVVLVVEIFLCGKSFGLDLCWKLSKSGIFLWR